MNFVEKLGKFADKLDDAGLQAHADTVDRIIEKIAIGETYNYDIDLQYVIWVPADLYQKNTDPSAIPAARHIKAEATVAVHPIQGGAATSQVLFNQKFVGKNLAELRQKLTATVTQLKTKFTPARVEETIQYKPVAMQQHAPAAQPGIEFTMGPATVR